MADPKDVLAQALSLEPQDRARLASRLLASLDGEPSDEVRAAWQGELVRRAEAANSADWEGDDWSVVRERVKPA
jgi:putative addiction module component (TIGR02574 family)